MTEKDFRRRSKQPAKYIIEPATAEQIGQAVGVTPEEAAYVRRVLIQMGYLRNITPEEKAAAGLKKPGRRQPAPVKL